MDLEISVPDLGAGADYVLDDCECSGPANLASYRIYQTIGTEDPSDRGLASGWQAPDLASGGPQPDGGTPIGQTISVRSVCSTGEEEIFKMPYWNRWLNRAVQVDSF